MKNIILLLHPNSSTNTEILDEVLTHWEKEGYKLKTLDYLNNKKYGYLYF